jgi:hypothetical protein
MHPGFDILPANRLSIGATSRSHCSDTTLWNGTSA